MRESIAERFCLDYAEMRTMGDEGPIGAVWWVLRGWIACAWDGSDPAKRLWQLRQDERPMAGCHECDEPLVLTFEFRGKEFVCVVCGQLYEYFGPKRLEWTPERQARHDELAARYDGQRKARTGA